ncbi:MAG TPA: DEAD/DEAH box helicase [Propionibacteriaceae bacterium]|nr:DEAD/DEAH box helicase [Propionibacteriaceae bacterium]
MDVLDRFSPATQAWFRSSFPAPTAAQAGAWEAILSGQHTLVVAPTGSGKTLSAFLWAIDGLMTRPPETDRSRCRVLYVSPLKALATDVERNLRSPLVGIGHASTRLGLSAPPVRVAVRSGDTPADERRKFSRDPADVLITTPESLFLLVTSQAREALTGIETVIIDEVHAVAATKRGAHLALTLERLDQLLARPAQRIGLSATVRPVEEVARFLAGGRPVEIVQPPSEKKWDLQVVVPVPDMAELAQPPITAGSAHRETTARPPQWDGTGDPLRTVLPPPAAATPSIWPHVEERIVDLVADHHSTLVFANSRRLAERLTGRLNEIWTERHDPDALPQAGSTTPAQVMAQSGSTAGAPAQLARAHHGSVSKEQRALIEDDLKAGRLPAVVATSSLELGIDMGLVDLVVQVEAPPSVASGLQRVGRAGHQVGAVSRGVLFPKFRGDLVSTAVIVERMRAGAIESLRVPANPLDVLAQQIVAMCALDDWAVGDVLDLVRRAAPYATLSRGVLDSVLDMLSGRYPSDEFAELRPRITWDRVTDTLSGRRGSQHLAVTSGGTIPDRGLFGVFLAGGDGPGRRVGELDEEMVYESRVGDVFTLGTSTWRVEDITHDRVLVTPAPGQPGRLPFWKGDTLGRPAELGAAVGGFVREVSALPADRARSRVLAAGLDDWAADNLLGYLREQKEATGHVPDDRTLLVERFRDELGDWRIVVHSPYGAPVHAPWALCVAARLRERYGMDVQAMPADDGIVLRLPDTSFDIGFDDDGDGRGSGGGSSGPPASLLEELLLEPDEVTDLVTTQLAGSAVFAARFRECAGRALLLPRRRPGQRQALWQQRQRSAQLLSVASQYPSFPIVLEAVRESVQDVFDVPGLVDLLRQVRSKKVRVVEVETASPSPYAKSLLFGYVAQFMYEGDSPLAERRAAALSLDPVLLAELLGGGDGLALADLLDPDALTRTEAELQHLDPGRGARDADDLADLLRVLGPMSVRELERRVASPSTSSGTDVSALEPAADSGTGLGAQAAAAAPSTGSGTEAGAHGPRAGSGTEPSAPEPTDGSGTEVTGWLGHLQQARRVFPATIGGESRWAAVEDAGRLRDALGVSLPVGLPDVFTASVADPLGDLVLRYARTHVPFGHAEVAAWLGVGSAVARDVCRRLVAEGRLVDGDLRPDGWMSRAILGAPEVVPAPHLCDPRVLALIRRRSLAALRAEVEPVAAADYARFLPAWQDVGGGLRGVDGVLRAVEQLAGVLLPASALESLALPARVRDYRSGMLDELTAAGEVVWQGQGELGSNDGWVTLVPADLSLLLPQAADDPAGAPDLDQRVLAMLATGAAWFVRPLADAVEADVGAVTTSLWRLVWAGRVTNDTLAPLRSRIGGSGAHKVRAKAPRQSRYGRPGLSPSRVSLRVPQPLDASGRWTVVPTTHASSTEVDLVRAEVLLDRYGIVTRGSVTAENIAGGFAGVYRVLAAAEEAGRVRRGYFVEGLGAAQFGGTGAVDRLRASARPLSTGTEGGDVTVLAACDPANPYGAALPWPTREPGPGESRGHQPARKAGALVVLVDGALALYVERGGRTLLSWGSALVPAARALAGAVHAGALGKLTVSKVDGASVMSPGSPLTAALEQAGFTLTPSGLRLRR